MGKIYNVTGLGRKEKRSMQNSKKGNIPLNRSKKRGLVPQPNNLSPGKRAKKSYDAEQEHHPSEVKTIDDSRVHVICDVNKIKDGKCKSKAYSKETNKIKTIEVPAAFLIALKGMVCLYLFCFIITIYD
jgi:hypothetical protein